MNSAMLKWATMKNEYQSKRIKVAKWIQKLGCLYISMEEGGELALQLTEGSGMRPHIRYLRLSLLQYYLEDVGRCTLSGKLGIHHLGTFRFTHEKLSGIRS